MRAVLLATPQNEFFTGMRSGFAAQWIPAARLVGVIAAYFGALWLARHRTAAVAALAAFAITMTVGVTMVHLSVSGNSCGTVLVAKHPAPSCGRRREVVIGASLLVSSILGAAFFQLGLESAAAREAEEAGHRDLVDVLKHLR